MATGLRRWSLRFADAREERGFLASRSPHLASSIFWCSLGLFCFGVAGLATILQDWGSSGHSFAAGADGARLASVRNWVSVTATLACLVSALLMKSNRFLAALGTRGLELHVAGLAAVAPMFVAAVHPWYLAKACGFSEMGPLLLGELSATDLSILLMIHALVGVVHVAVPIRWLALLPFQVVATLSYAVPAMGLGGPVDLTFSVLQLLVLVFLIVIQSYGKRRAEINERLAFSRIAVEKTLRFQIEHQLKHIEAPCRSSSFSSLTVEVGWLPTTTQTGQHFLFTATEEGSLGAAEDLQRIGNLGYTEHWLVEEAALQPVPGRIIGFGGFGVVLPALYHGAAVVVKAPREPVDGLGARGLPAIAHELRILRRVRHPNIVMFYGACILPDSSELVLVLEYVRGSPLQDFVGAPPAKPTTGDRCNIANDICCALWYLHGQTPPIVHGDLKGSNVLVVSAAGLRPNAKLVDFGLSRLITRRARPLGGTLHWMAPELLLNRHNRPAASADVFCFGRLLYMIMTGCRPLEGMPQHKVLAALRLGQPVALAWPSNGPLVEECRALSDACLEVEPLRRPSIVEAQAKVQHWMVQRWTSSGRGPCADPEQERLAAQSQQQAEPEGGIHSELRRARAALPPRRPRRPPGASRLGVNAEELEDAHVAADDASCRPGDAASGPEELAGTVAAPRAGVTIL